MQFQHSDMSVFVGDQEAPQGQAGRAAGNDVYAKVGRNDPCPCGSGKKFKYCHGQLA